MSLKKTPPVPQFMESDVTGAAFNPKLFATGPVGWYPMRLIQSYDKEQDWDLTGQPRRVSNANVDSMIRRYYECGGCRVLMDCLNGKNVKE